MLNQLRRRIWPLGSIAIAIATFTPAAWGDPNLSGHTAQDPTPPWKDPPGGDRAPYDPNAELVPAILLPSTPLSAAMRDLDARSLGLDGWSWSSIPIRQATFDRGGSPIGPVPAPGALALLGLGTLIARSSRRRR